MVELFSFGILFILKNRGRDIIIDIDITEAITMIRINFFFFDFGLINIHLSYNTLDSFI